MTKTIWLDILTPKQARLMYAIKEWFHKDYEFIATSRENAETQYVLKQLDFETKVIGRHGISLKEKAFNRFQRQQTLFDNVVDWEIDFSISHVSPSAIHVAYALGIPVITLNDTMWANHVNTLTLPYTNHLICSIAFSEKYTSQTWRNTYPTNSNLHVHHFNGVDEVIWVNDWLETFEHTPQDPPVITIRMPEYHAAYAQPANFPYLNNILDALTSLKESVKIKVLIRYGNELKLTEKEETQIEYISYSDPLEIYEKSSLFIGVGGTMCREAALLGIPSISLYYHSFVNKFVSMPLGYPLYNIDLKDLPRFASRLLEMPIKTETSKNLVPKLETPLYRVNHAILAEINK